MMYRNSLSVTSLANEALASGSMTLVHMLVHVHADVAGMLKARTHIQTGPLTSDRHDGIAEDLQKEAFSETGQQMARNLMMSKTLRRTRKLGHDVT